MRFDRRASLSLFLPSLLLSAATEAFSPPAPRGAVVRLPCRSDAGKISAPETFSASGGASSPSSSSSRLFVSAPRKRASGSGGGGGGREGGQRNKRKEGGGGGRKPAGGGRGGGDGDATRSAWAKARERRLARSQKASSSSIDDEDEDDAGGGGGIFRDGSGGGSDLDNYDDEEVESSPPPRSKKPPISPPRSSDVLRSAKSIDELESILSGRWGTRLNRWTADPTEYEMIGDDDNKGGGKEDSSSGGESGGGLGLDLVEEVAPPQSELFRSKPVLNPWEKAELSKRRARAAAESGPKKKKGGGNGGDGGMAGTLRDASRRNDRALKRVMANQERMRRKKEERDEARRRSDPRSGGGPSDDVVDEGDMIMDEDDVPSGMVLEFHNEDGSTYEVPQQSGSTSAAEYYDEDDYGYGNDDDDDYGTVISPRPAARGGGGSRSGGGGGGFFFRPEADVDDSLAPREQRRDKQRASSADAAAHPAAKKTKSRSRVEEADLEETKKRKRRDDGPPTRPVLDDRGREMLLTLDQAAANARKFLVDDEDQVDTDYEDGYDEDDEDAPPPSLSTTTSSASTTWEKLGVTHPVLLDNLQSRPVRARRPLPAQVRSIPAALAGNDVLVSSHTGSGKTLAFLVPSVQRMLYEDEAEAEDEAEHERAEVSAVAGDSGTADVGDGWSLGWDEEDGDINTAPTPNKNSDKKKKPKKKKRKKDQGPRLLVIAPGRELSSQIVSVARDLVRSTDLKVALAIGGTPYQRTVDMLRRTKPDVVVGTPGRIAELIVGRPGEKKTNKGGRMKLGALRTVVLDEFDALLGYDAHRDPTEATVAALRRRRGGGGAESSAGGFQTILCSATAVDAMGNGDKGSKLNADGLLRPGYAHAASEEDDALLTDGSAQSEQKRRARISRTAIHGTVRVPHRGVKMETLRRVLNAEPLPPQALIFVDGSRRVELVVEKLSEMGIVAAPLHGGRSSLKSDRAEVSRSLRDGYVGIVVCTELAARGIDAPYLTHVINLDLPTDASHYAHRAGRCGRGGRPGVVINLAVGNREWGVPDRFGRELGVDVHRVECRGGKLRVVEEVAKEGDER